MSDSPRNDQRNNRRRQRLRNHLLLFVVSIGAAAGLYFLLAIPHPEPGSWIFRMSLATAYVASVLLAATLSVGVWNLIRHGSSPLSTDLRRDLGIWCGIFAVAHTIVGLNVHMQSWTQYFVADAGGPRMDFFGLANYLGIAASAIVIVLLATSNDRSITLLRSRNWKRVQRWSYLFAALTGAHAILYIAIEKRLVPYLFIVAAITAYVLAIQLTGITKRTAAAKNVPGPNPDTKST